MLCLTLKPYALLAFPFAAIALVATAARTGADPAFIWTALTGMAAGFITVVRWVVLLTRDVADLKTDMRDGDERLRRLETLTERVNANQEDIKTILAFMVTQNSAAEAFVALRNIDGPTVPRKP